MKRPMEWPEPPAEADKVDQSELIKALGVPQLIALLDGLEVPNPEWWIANQPPSAFMALGKEIAGQAKLIT